MQVAILFYCNEHLKLTDVVFLYYKMFVHGENDLNNIFCELHIGHDGLLGEFA